MAGLLSELIRPTTFDRLRGRGGGWRMLHSVPLAPHDGRPTDIDHLLIGPPGVVASLGFETCPELSEVV